MAYLKLYRSRLKHNYDYIKQLFDERSIQWGIVTKMLCGNQDMIQEVLNLGVHEVHDSRLSNLQIAKQLDPNVRTVYIKPPPHRIIPDIVESCDVSLNSEYDTIRCISEEAQRQGKTHEIIIMIEMGDLREGVMGEELVAFYERVFRLPNIRVIGLGTNLNCLYGVLPSTDKLIQLSLYKQIIEAKFNKKIPLVSAGTSVTIPLLLKKMLPKGVNHFRVGEALYFGTDLFTGETMEGMRDDVFELFAQVIELQEKPVVPMGEMGVNVAGEMTEVDESLYGKTSYRAIIDVGLLEVKPEALIPKHHGAVLVGASSDMLVVDIGDNQGNVKVGDLLRFNMNYMGALSLLNSHYIDHYVED
jgi:predicted amino acid racemase